MIDSSIPLQVKGPRPLNIGARMNSLSQIGMQQEMNDLKLKEARQNSVTHDAVLAILKAGGKPDEIKQKLMAAGAIDVANAFEEHAATMDLNALNQAAAKLKLENDKLTKQQDKATRILQEPDQYKRWNLYANAWEQGWPTDPEQGLDYLNTIADRKAVAEYHKGVIEQARQRDADSRTATEFQAKQDVGFATGDLADFRRQRGPRPTTPGYDEIADFAAYKRRMSSTQEDRTFEDFQNSPALSAKYGGTRVGFEKWQNDEKIRVAKGSKDDPSYVPTPGSMAAGDISQYPQDVQNLAKQLVKYSIPLPSGMALANPKSPWNAAIQAAAILDPSFDASQYAIRKSLRQDFTSGKSAQAITSLNTVIGHLDTLSKRADELKNKLLPSYNRAANAVLSETGNPAVKNFEIARNAVADELLKVFRSTGGTESEVQAWKQQIDSSGSPEQLKGAVNQALELLGSRVAALQNQYERGLGKPKDFQFFTAKSREILKRLGANAESMESGSVGAATANLGDSVGDTDTITIIDPAGGEHTILRKNLAEAIKRAPGTREKK